MTSNGHERAKPLRTGDPHALGEYRIQGRLGRGGMGTVYLAKNTNNRSVAVKLIHPDLSDDADFRRRFAREVRAAQSVARFSTAAVIDAQLDGDPLFIVSEYVPGPNLAEAIHDEGPMDGGTLEGLAMGVAAALAAIHGAGVIHRDLKPGNVLLSTVGPKVIDFGIARAMDDDSAVTRSSQLMGTPAYLAPELIEGTTITPASDIFSWGCLVAFAGTGNPPFDAASVPAVLHQISTSPPNLEGLDPTLAELALRALTKDPAQRPTAQQLLNRLVGQEDPSDSTVGQTVSRSWTPPSTARPPTGAAPGMGPTAAAGTGAAAGALAGTAMAGAPDDGTSEHEAPPAAGVDGTDRTTDDLSDQPTSAMPEDAPATGVHPEETPSTGPLDNTPPPHAPPPSAAQRYHPTGQQPGPPPGHPSGPQQAPYESPPTFPGGPYANAGPPPGPPAPPGPGGPSPYGPPAGPGGPGAPSPPYGQPAQPPGHGGPTPPNGPYGPPPNGPGGPGTPPPGTVPPGQPRQPDRRRKAKLIGAGAAALVLVAGVIFGTVQLFGGPSFPGGSTLTNDNFTDTDSGWDESMGMGAEFDPKEPTMYTSGYYKEQYALVGVSESTSDSTQAGLNAAGDPFKGNPPGQVGVSVDARAQKGPDQATMGMYCFGQGDVTSDWSAYVLEFRFDGAEAKVERISDKQGQKTIETVQDPSGFDVEPKANNKLQATCEYNKDDKAVDIRMWVNDTFALETSDDQPLGKSGNSGILTRRPAGGSGGPSIVYFDNYSLLDITE